MYVVRKIYWALLVINCYVLYSQYHDKAVIIVPVADLFFDQLSMYDPKKKSTTEQLYCNTPIASNNSKFGCFRATQALFNDVVTIVQKKGEEIRIDLGRIFFDAPDRTPLKYFWTHASNLMTLHDLLSKQVDVSLIPQPISMLLPQTLTNRGCVTLIMPWFDTVTKKKYSVGTRFVRHHNSTIVPNHIKVYVFDPQLLKIKESQIPREYCFINSHMNNRQKQNAYVSFLKRWAHNKNGVVPYVWGGASITDFVEDNFCIKESHFADQPISYYERPALKSPYGGIDCSGLIARAAQICAIPYYFKNTLTLAQHLRPLTAEDSIEEGDLLWYPGHVMIVSDIGRNEIIESAGYPSGYGKLHGIKLGQKFQNISTYNELFGNYLQKKEITILNKDGTVAKRVRDFVIYKFSSVWDQ
jgi:hypothetical protein